MITVSITRKNNIIKGFEFTGHAGYAEEGYDIVCSAVSALSINTVNSIEALTKDDMVCSEPGEESGFLSFSIEAPSKEAKLLFDSLELGLNMIVEGYGDDYLEIKHLEEL